MVLENLQWVSVSVHENDNLIQNVWFDMNHPQGP
jgi:hypothetical protein